MRPLSSQPFNSDRLEYLINPTADFKRIFKGDKLTDEALDICLHLNIDPSDMQER